jgi:hypothetical protein
MTDTSHSQAYATHMCCDSLDAAAAQRVDSVVVSADPWSEVQMKLLMLVLMM